MAFYRCGGGGGTNLYSDAAKNTVGDVKTAALKPSEYISSSPNWYRCNNIFRNNATFNDIVVVGENVAETRGMLYNAKNFSKPVIFMGNNLSDAATMFSSAVNFNCPITFRSEQDLSLGSCFFGCKNFNSYVTMICNKNLYCDSMFANCTNLTHFPLVFALNPTQIRPANMFKNSAASNTWANDVKRFLEDQVIYNYWSMFENTSLYFGGVDNYTINLKNGSGAYFRGMFANTGGELWANNFHLNAAECVPFVNTGGNTFFFCYQMFDRCNNVQNVTITPPTGAVQYDYASFGYMFNNCQYFNGKFDLNGSISSANTRLNGLFSGCMRYNQNINLLNFGTITNASHMFAFCFYAFNQKIDMNGEQGFNDCSYMFYDCGELNSIVRFPVSTMNYAYACAKTNLVGSKIYIKGNAASDWANKNFVGLVAERRSTARLNIWCNNWDALTGTTPETSITGTEITWAVSGNAKYNAQYNIYILKNYSNVTNAP